MSDEVASSIQPTRWMHDMLQQGFALLAAKRLNEASECCRRLLAAKPDVVEGHFLVGLIALELKQTWAAVSAFGSVTKLKTCPGSLRTAFSYQRPGTVRRRFSKSHTRTSRGTPKPAHAR